MQNCAEPRLAFDREQSAKGHQPVNAPGAYLDQLVRHAAESARDKAACKDGVGGWGFALTEYEIIR